MADEEAPEVNHYQVLGIERTADERAIKKAYFKLVRQYPPDTHPEDFKRIRAAYELLSDPILRQRFDNADKGYLEYPPEVAARLRGLEKLGKEVDPATFGKALEELVADHPEVVVARENLGTHYARNGAFDKALDTWKTLEASAPEVPRYKLFKGIAFHHLKQADNAIKALRAASALAPTELRFTIALVDVLIANNKNNDALEELAGALGDSPAEIGKELALGLRRIEALCRLKRLAEAEKAIDRLAKRAASESDAELPKYVASQIAGLAAKLFARKDFTEANALLARAAEIDPASPVARPLPPKAELDVRALPKATTDWLATLAPGARSPTLAETDVLRPALSLIGAAVVALIAEAVIGAGNASRSEGNLAIEIALVVLAAAAIAFAVREAVSLIQSPIGAFITIHPLYLVRARTRKLVVYPLFWLDDLKGTHHHRNGVYTRTQISLGFGKETVSVAIANKDYAQAWLNHVVECRARSLELMAEGYLEAEQGIVALPPVLVAEMSRPRDASAPAPAAVRGVELPPPSLQGRRAEDLRRGLVRWYGAAAGIAAVGVVALAATNGARNDRGAFARALADGSSKAYAAYLKAFPNGRYEKQAQAKVDASYHLRWDPAKASATPPPGAAVLALALEAQRAAGAPLVEVTLRTEIAPELKGAVEPALDDLGVRGNELSARWGRIFARAGVGEAMPVANGRADGGQVTIRFAQTIRPGSGPAGIAIDCEAILEVKGKSAQRSTVHVEMPPRLLVPHPSGNELAKDTQRALETRALDACSDRLAAELGLAGVSELATFAPEPNGQPR